MSEETAGRWAAPPENMIRWHRPVKYMDVSDKMRSGAGHWREFARPTPRAAYNFADNIRRGRLVAFMPAGSFEAMARGTTVWARYMGEGLHTDWRGHDEHAVHRHTADGTEWELHRGDGTPVTTASEQAEREGGAL